MSILLVAPPIDLGEALIHVLTTEGDEVRVVEPDPARSDRWSKLGAHVASGTPDDDLVERAALGCRTIVFFGMPPHELVTGAVRAEVERAIILTESSGRRLDVEPGSIESVVLITGRRRLLGRSRLGTEDVARAINATDDLSEPPRELDLREEDSWDVLGLSRP